MNFLKKNLWVLFLAAFLVIVPIFSFAQEIVDDEDYIEGSGPCKLGSGKICNPINADSIPELIRIILEGVIKIGIPIIALAIIYCGFLFVSAQGKPEAITKAKSALLYTLVGSAILLGSWAIAKLISETVLAL